MMINDSVYDADQYLLCVEQLLNLMSKLSETLWFNQHLCHLKFCCVIKVMVLFFVVQQ